MMNNALNNSRFFDYKHNAFFEKLRYRLIVSLTAILFLDYVFAAWINGADHANEHLWQSLSYGGFMILILATNLSRFDLIPNYWRKIKVFTEDLPNAKRIKPSRDAVFNYVRRVPEIAIGGLPNIIRANVVYPKNFIGQRVGIDNVPNNDLLENVLTSTHYGSLKDRKIVMGNDAEEISDGDPDWFLLELDEPLKLDGSDCYHFLIRFKAMKPSLTYDKDLVVLLCTFHKEKNIEKDQISYKELENLGWTIVNKA